MAPNILITGVTGYVGGTVFNTIVTAHPEYNITVLLRNPQPSFSEKYPNVKVLKGEFGDFELLKDAASKADVVVHHGDSDNVAAVRALLAGASERAAASLPAFYIHLGGTGIIVQYENLGELHPKVWSDIGDIETLWSMPEATLHRNTELLIQDAWTARGVKTAVVCPPMIHGRGTGPGRTDSMVFPALVSASVQTGSTFYYGSGTNIYSKVHIEDVAQVFSKLVEAAANGGEGADWGHDGYYFLTSEEVNQKDIAVAAGKILKQKGLVPTEEPKQLTLEELDSLLPQSRFPGVARLAFASNSRSTPDRTKKVLSYVPRGLSYMDSLEDDISRAARR
ncbi:hypothetical protein KVR01_013567 [Diaporthe batatas]|uniref:uncharacterized protein n=1 Tax=Diaporthe batatas TaxID=748121 RepID=UPI001D03B440|nr:uncharacterized protein KVR01_013567 [Diaporthe batatas]KAG8156616.1 hypothetical protein KVR01_013567 [Diaporthe batatas]